MRLADRYRLLRRVGEGGGGGVWLVEDRLAHNAVMVLKRLNAQAQAGLAHWLVNEFQILAQLDLPTVARVFDFGLAQADSEDPGGTFFTRAFVDGVPLDEAFAQDPDGPSPHTVRALFASAALTLRELHRMGVVHGDLKPANLIVPPERDRVILIDFGLAHGALAASTHVHGGTLAFMPPERQARLFAGEALAPDPNADVYGLAVSLLVVLAGEAPSADLSAPPRVTASAELTALWEVGRRGASEDPARRFATVDDLAVALGIGVGRERSPGARVVLRPEGREAELGVLLDAVARRLVRRETGVSAALVVGEEGSGRSTLLRELTWRAQLRGVQVLSVEGEPGDAPWQRLREGAEILSGASVDVAVPDAIEAALRAATKHAPVLILADDLDQADPAIVALLRSIAYGCEASEALLVVATAEDAGRVGELEAGVTVPLGALDEESVAALCQQVLGPLEPAVASAIYRRTEALPLRVIEMLAALAEEGAVTPADVESVEVTGRASDVAARRVRAMDPAVRDAAAAVAVLGGDAHEASVRALVSDAEALARARAEGVVTLRADGRWELTHAALEPAVLASMEPASERELLRRAAQTLAQRASVSAASKARAWLRAGDAARATAHVGEAVETLKKQGLPLAAARLLGSLRLLDPAGTKAEALLSEAELLHAAGVVGEALTLGERVASGDGETAACARLLVGRLLRIGGEVARAEEMMTALAAGASGDLAAEAEVEAGRAAMLRGDYGAVLSRCERAWTVARAPRVRATAWALAGVAASWSGDTARGEELLEKARGEYARLELPGEESGLLVYLGVGREQSGDLNGARALHERSLEKARAAGDLRAMVTARINLGHIAQRMGDLGAALTHDEAALTLARRAGLRQAVLAARLNMASGLLRIGSFDRARAELDEALAQALSAGARDMAAAATLMLGNVKARAGDGDAGLVLVAQASAAFESLGQADDAVDAELDASEILLMRGAAGDVVRAWEHLARARRGGRLGLREARARMLEGRGMLSRGDARGAQLALGEAIAAAEAQSDWEVLSQALGVRAEAHLATGAELHARRDRERAIEVLEAKGALLPPDLRGAFWSVGSRASLRAELARSGVGAEVDARGAKRGLSFSMNVNAPTLIANDERLVLLLELSKRVGEEHTLERVLEQAVRSAVELTHAESGAILLAGDGGALETRVRRGAHFGDAPDEQFSRTIAETVWIDGEPVVTLNARGDRRFADFRSVHDLGIGAVAAVPIRARGRALGVLYVENRQRRGAWTSSDVALMQAFAEQAGTAVEHARLVEELEGKTRELEAAHREIEALLEERTSELEDTRKSLARAQQELKRRFAPEGLVAQTEPMRRLFAMIDRVRDSDVPVVIEGESGTGKELVARALHFSGARSKGPFVVVHCGAIPETLLESELFGHVKGSFTGADRDRKGLIASAHTGTLMLDEMAEMSPRMQVELLRVLQDRKVRPVGSEREETVDVRVVVASNRVLKDMVAEGRLREDLYYRLSVVTLRIPPLRERIEDIPALASHFLARFAEEHGGARKRLSRAAMEKLMRGQWPGNVRQLQHALESAVVFTEGEEIPAEALSVASGTPAEMVETAPSPAASTSGSPMAARKASERQKILDALEQVNWNKVRAAQVLGMPRRTLYRRLREFGLLD